MTLQKSKIVKVELESATRITVLSRGAIKPRMCFIEHKDGRVQRVAYSDNQKRFPVVL